MSDCAACVIERNHGTKVCARHHNRDHADDNPQGLALVQLAENVRTGYGSTAAARMVAVELLRIIALIDAWVYADDNSYLGLARRLDAQQALREVGTKDPA